MNKQNKNKGWEEQTDPFTLNRKGKPVAKRHHEVAESAKMKGRNIMAEPFAAPEKSNEKRVVVFQFKKNIETDKHFNDVLAEFQKDYPGVEFEYEKNRLEVISEVDEWIEEFVYALTDTDLEFSVTEAENKDEVDEIIDEARMARQRDDKQQTTKDEFDKDLVDVDGDNNEINVLIGEDNEVQPKQCKK